MGLLASADEVTKFFKYGTCAAEKSSLFLLNGSPISPVASRISPLSESAEACIKAVFSVVVVCLCVCVWGCNVMYIRVNYFRYIDLN
jgi:hypothetical protein